MDFFGFIDRSQRTNEIKMPHSGTAVTYPKIGGNSDRTRRNWGVGVNKAMTTQTRVDALLLRMKSRVSENGLDIHK